MRENITAVMIVKDEEAVLERCLDSIKDIMPIVIADTGSTDRTMEIAREYGAEVYEHPWQDSFSEARNWIKQHVKTTWALQIDADEEVAESTVSELDKLDAKYDAYQTPIHNIMQDGSMNLHHFERICQPAKAHYKWRVHNELVFDGDVGLAGLSFLHHGYSVSDEELQRKYANTLRLLLMDVDDAGYVMRNVRYLIQTYRVLKRHIDVLAVIDEHLEKLISFPGLYQEAAASAIVAYNALDNNTKAKAAGVMLIEKFPEALDALFYLGVAYMQDQLWDSAMVFFARYVKVRIDLQMENIDTSISYHTWGNRAEAFHHIAFCNSMMGNKIVAAVFSMRAEMLAKHRSDIAGFAANTDQALCLLLGDSQPAQPKIMNLTEPDSEWDKPKKQLLTMEAD